MLYTCSRVQWRRRPTTVVAAVLLALAVLTPRISTAQKLLQAPMKGGLTPSGNLSFQVYYYNVTRGKTTKRSRSNYLQSNRYDVITVYNHVELIITVRPNANVCA